METLGLFDAPGSRVLGAHGDPDGLRPYQREGCTATDRELLEHRGTMNVLATGLGKSQMIGALCRGWGDRRVLVIAHTQELTAQLRERIEAMTGELVGLEQAESSASGERIVVASVQTLARGEGKRAQRFLKHPFDFILTDECHHAVAKSYGTIYDLFPAAKLVGFTATAGRKGLKKRFDSVAYKMDLADGMEQAWLSPLEIKPIESEVDLDQVEVDKKGDLAVGQLDAVMAQAVAPIAQAAVEMAGEAATLIFTPGVKTAHACAARLNEMKPGSARAIDGSMDKDLRRQILQAHKRREFPYLLNCQVLTEGYDDPGLIYEIIARPTLSWALYAQMLGRLTRLWPGCDKLPTAEERRAAIASSPKPKCILLDLALNSEKHQLAGPVDLLGGKYSEEVRKRAKKILREEGGDPKQALERAKEELKRVAAIAARAKVTLKVREGDPFAMLGMKDPERGNLRIVNPAYLASEKQIRYLRRLEIDVPENCTGRQANKLIGAAKMREEQGLCSYKQVKWLARFGINGARMYEATGKKIADAYRVNGRVMPAADVIDRIIHAPREAGLEG